jgi:hypothetical protein
LAVLLLLLLVLVAAAPAGAQSVANGAIQTTNPALPPGLPSPSLAPIPASLSPIPGIRKNARPMGVAPRTAGTPTNELGPNDIGLDNADQILMDEDTGVDTITGNVQVRYRTYMLTADQAVVDTDSGVATFTGRVRLESDDKSVSVRSRSVHSSLVLHLRQGTYSVYDGSAVIAPSAIPSVTGLLLPLRLYGGDINGASHLIDAKDTSVTTCDFASPHYFFTARSTTIIPGKRLIARHVTLYRRHKKIVTIPYLVFPLDDRYLREGLTPQVGEDEQEGYFVKFATPYVLTGTAPGILRLDLMSKMGVGTGFDQDFSTGGSQPVAKPLPSQEIGAAAGTPTSGVLPNSQTSNIGIFGTNSLQGGTLQIYHLADSSLGTNSTTGSFTDSQRLFHNIRLSIDTQFQNDSYLSSLTTSNALSGQFAVSRTVPGAETSLTANVQQSDYGLGTSRTITSAISEQNVLSKITTSTVKVDFDNFSSPSIDGLPGTSQDSLATSLDITSHPKGYQMELLTNTFNAESSNGTSTVTGGVQRLPELTLQSVPTPTDQLWPRLLPALTKYILDLGDFKETTDNTQDLRAEMGLDIGDNRHTYKLLQTAVSGSVLQSFYSDNTARYVLQDQVQETYNFQKLSSFGATYSYLRPYGYTPFLFDETGSYNNANFNLNYQMTKRLLTTLSSGFDFGDDHSMYGLPATPWLDINGQIEYKIDSRLLNVLTGSYDPNRGLLFNAADTTRITLPWGLAFNSALNYVPQSGKFSNINGDLDLPWIVDPKEQAGYRLRVLAGYDGLTDTFNYQALELTRSWHDWEISGIYNDNADSLTPGKSFYINFRLKAFPGFEPFGVGQFGQGLDTGTGQVY